MTTPLLIGGEERPGADSFPVYDPSNGEVIGHAAAASTADALDAVRAAHEAWPAWAALPTAERVQLSLAALAGLESDADERAELLVRENGKTRFEATIDPLVLVGPFHQAAAVAPSLDDDEVLAGPPFTHDDRPRPAGRRHDHLPVQLAARDSRREPPVRAHGRQHRRGQPPPTTPMSVVRTLRHIALALPPGVLNVVTGADAVVGPVVIGDPRVKHVCFTGSVGGGKAIMQMAAANLTRVTARARGQRSGHRARRRSLRRGGDRRMAMATYMTTGQVCMALKRLYVPRRASTKSSTASRLSSETPSSAAASTRT